MSDGLKIAIQRPYFAACRECGATQEFNVRIENETREAYLAGWRAGRDAAVGVTTAHWYPDSVDAANDFMAAIRALPEPSQEDER